MIRNLVDVESVVGEAPAVSDKKRGIDFTEWQLKHHPRLYT